MATSVLYIAWDRPVRGTEERAYEYLFNEGLPYLRSAQGQAFERYELIGLTAHRGDLNACIILFGERSKLDELRRSDAFEVFAITMNGLFERFGVVPGINEAGILAVMARRAAAKQ